MRELKFMVLDQEGNWECVSSEKDNLWKLHEVYPKDMIRQWTGLQDKNSVDIYEGDIVVVELGDDFDLPNMKKGTPCLVVWSEKSCGFVLEDEAIFHGDIGLKWGNRWRIPYDKDLKVIGNVYENSKLLNEVKE